MLRLSSIHQPELPAIEEESDDAFSLKNTRHLETSLREAVKSRKSWQKRGVALFESFLYVLLRNTVILGSFVLCQFSQQLFDLEDEDGKFANEWVLIYTIFNILLLIDLVFAILFYGIKTLYSSRTEFVWEACI